MADIFISYTSSDRDWAFWIAKELEALGHTPHIHEWEIKGGDDIYAWMEQRHDAADHVLCVVSDEYLKAPYSTLERNAALWQAADKRPDFVLFVVGQAMQAADAQRPHQPLRTVRPARGGRRDCGFANSWPTRAARRRPTVPRPKSSPLSNIPIRVPTHFMGRDERSPRSRRR